MTEQTPERTESSVAQCPHARCGAAVIKVRLGPNLVPTLLDYEPVTWVDGGRVRVSTVQVNPDALVAYRIQHAGRAFGIKRLFRPHDETCRAEQRRTRTRATSS